MPILKFLRKWLPILFAWLFFILIALEGGLRLVAEQLPPRLQPAAHYVQTGTLYDANRVNVAYWSGDYGTIFPPDLQDEPVQLSPVVNARVTTLNLWDTGVGFRTPPINYAVDIVVVGDSHSFCFTEYDECWVTKLRDMSNKGIVNFGQPGTGSISRRNIVHNFARPLEPGLVLWQWTGNDFNEDYGLAVEQGAIEPVEDNIQPPEPELDENRLINGLRRNSLLFATLESIFIGRAFYVDDNEKMFLASHYIEYEQGRMGVGRPVDDVVYDIGREANQLGLPYTEQMLREAKAEIEDWGGELVMILFPASMLTYQHLAQEVLSPEMMARQVANYEVPRKLCVELDIQCIDLLPVFQQSARNGEHLYYTDDGHLNPYGNTVMAQAVADWLQAEGWLD